MEGLLFIARAYTKRGTLAVVWGGRKVAVIGSMQNPIGHLRCGTVDDWGAKIPPYMQLRSRLVGLSVKCNWTR